MRRRIPGLVAAALLPLAAAALEGPHSGVFDENCDSCHTAHKAPGTSLTDVAGNANLCFSCHNAPSQSPYFGKWNELTDQALPGTSGHSHSWTGAATGHGATPPAPGTPMGIRLPGGNLQCSTCHDQHNYAESAGGSRHVSPVEDHSAGGALSVDPPGASALARGYLIDIVDPGIVGAATFRISHDGFTWFGWNGSWSSSATGGKPTGTNVSLDDSAVTVDFTGTFAAGDRFSFYVGRAFLRVPNAEDAMCTTCHANRNMTHAAWGESTTGATVFSHPVGVAMNANGHGYDRAPDAILDADGATTQLTGDGNWTNDLNLSASNKVTCTTCHAPHNADSNSLSTDTR